MYPYYLSDKMDIPTGTVERYNARLELEMEPKGYMPS